MWISCFVFVTLVALTLLKRWRRKQRGFAVGAGRMSRRVSDVIACEPRASVFASDKTIILVKNKVWVNGPIYIHDLPWRRFALDDLDGIQGFLCEILTTPMKKEGGNMPAFPPTKNFLRLLQAKGLRHAVETYQCAQVRIENGSLIVTTYKRDLSTKSWSETETIVREPNWKQDRLGVQALLEGFAKSE